MGKDDTKEMVLLAKRAGTGDFLAESYEVLLG